MKGVVYGFYFRRIIQLLLLLLVSVSCSSEEVNEASSEKLSGAYSTLELELLNMVNDYRLSAGHNVLTRLDEVSEQARMHCEHMVKTKEVCHHNFGRRYKNLAEKVGAKSMGENVGYGYRTSDAIFRAWLRSPDHLKIIVGEKTHFGISARGAEDKMYVTLIVIRK